MCNLRCVFCQNYDISRANRGSGTSPQRLAGMMIELQAMGCHNINFVLDGHGLAKRGMLVRHLVMPGGIAGTESIMRFLAEELSPDTYVNLMNQYYPAGRVSSSQFPEINRRITSTECQQALDAARAAGLWRFDQRDFW